MSSFETINQERLSFLVATILQSQDGLFKPARAAGPIGACPNSNLDVCLFAEAARLALAAQSSKVVVFAPWSPGGGPLRELRRVMTRLARSRALGRVAAKLGLQFHEVDEVVGLTAQFVGDHRRLAGNRRDDGHPDAATLYRFATARPQLAKADTAFQAHPLVNRLNLA